MNQEFPRRRWYDECNISEADLVKIDHRFTKIEDDVADLKQKQKGSEEMLIEIHDTICKSKNILTGFRLGAGSVIAIIAIAISVIGGFFTGKISIVEIIKMFFG